MKSRGFLFAIAALFVAALASTSFAHTGSRSVESPGTPRQRAIALFDEAVALAESGRTEPGWIFRFVVKEIASVDADRALAVVERIPSQYYRDEALVAVVGGLSESDPGRALDVARRIVRGDSQAAALTAVAVRVVKADPDRALSLVDEVKSPNRKAAVLDAVLYALALADLPRALRATEEMIPDPFFRDMELRNLATTMVFEDADRAIALSEHIADPNERASVQRFLAAELAKFDLGKAREVAESITVEAEKQRALKAIAENSAKSGVKPLESLRFDATDARSKVAVIVQMVGETAWQDETWRWMRALLLEGALNLTAEIADPDERAYAVYSIARQMDSVVPGQSVAVFEMAARSARQAKDPLLLAQIAVAMWDLPAPPAGQRPAPAPSPSRPAVFW